MNRITKNALLLIADTRLRNTGIGEMTKIWERLFVGSREDAEYLFRSNPHGITSVVTLCEDEVIRRAPGVNYVHIPIMDGMRISIGQFDAIIDAIAENIRWGTVLIRCVSGYSRAPIMTAAWMHVVGYKSIDAALAETARLRPEINPSPVLLESVKEHL
jgi:protein-tyrosine phosphatase